MMFKKIFGKLLIYKWKINQNHLYSQLLAVSKLILKKLLFLEDIIMKMSQQIYFMYWILSQIL